MYYLNITQADITPRFSPNGEETSYSLFVDAERKTLSIHEYVPGQSGVPTREWHGFYMPIDIAGNAYGVYQTYPDANSLAKLIASDDAQELLQMLVEGFSTRWDGNGLIGQYDDAAKAAADKLEKMIASLPRESYVVWGAWEWMQAVNAADFGIDAETEDEQLSSIAESIAADAFATGNGADHVIVDESDILSIIMGWRDDLREDL